ncbi:MAG: sialate O-acetylesterase [Puia sp.]|nr:sialate O-acetylesterase [Puia sp.]
MKKACPFLFLILTTLSFHLSVFADIRLPSVIGSNMVLQQQSDCKLWGWCEPNEKIYITASWNNRTDSAIGTRDAKWMVPIPTPAAGGPYTLTLKGRNTIILQNLMIGEVWICSGQSNMEMSGPRRLPDIRDELAACATNDIHFFRIPRTTAAWPQEGCSGEWTACDSNTLKSFSAAAYFFGRKLNQELHVPIGLIESAWGGTPAEVWTPAALVNEDAALAESAKRLEVTDGWPYTPGLCYNGMIAPVVPYNIKGAIWYQGESNTIAPETYSRLFSTMIASWRRAWNKELSFYYVQIAPFTYDRPGEGSLLREQQALTMKLLPGTGMVVISDLVSDTTDIHPKDKHDVGLRLAGWALAETYHKDGIVYRSPSFKSMEVRGDKIAIQLENAPQGLIVKGPHVKTLFVAGADQQFYPADAKWENGHWIVRSPQVKDPVAVRYQFSNAGIGNVFGREGLPLAPFRTDDWALADLAK